LEAVNFNVSEQIERWFRKSTDAKPTYAAAPYYGFLSNEASGYAADSLVSVQRLDHLAETECAPNPLFVICACAHIQSRHDFVTVKLQQVVVA
jgi:hypothetical protein